MQAKKLFLFLIPLFLFACDDRHDQPPVFSFYISQEEEYPNLMRMMCDNFDVSVAERALQYNIPYDIYKKIENCKDDDGALKKFLAESYKDKYKAMHDVLSKLSRNGFSSDAEKLAKVFGYKIPKYRVRLDAHIGGTSNPGDGYVSLRYDQYDNQETNDTTEFEHYLVWEVALAETWNHMDKMFADGKLPPVSADKRDYVFWGVSEMAAWMITEHSNEFHFKQHEIQYPTLRAHKDEAVKLWESKTGFDDWIIEMVKMLK